MHQKTYIYLWKSTFLCFVMEFSILRYSTASFLEPSSSSFSFSTALTLFNWKQQNLFEDTAFFSKSPLSIHVLCLILTDQRRDATKIKFLWPVNMTGNSPKLFYTMRQLYTLRSQKDNFKNLILKYFPLSGIKEITFSPRASFRVSTSLANCSIGSLKRLDPMMSSRYSNIPSSCSDWAFGFIMEICSTSPCKLN